MATNFLLIVSTQCLSRYISETEGYIVAMEDEQKVVCDLSDGTILNDLE